VALTANDPTVPNRVFLQAVVSGLFCEMWSCSERSAVARLLEAEPPDDPIFANLSDRDLDTCLKQSKLILAGRK
jgi:hypothetical protein